MMATHLQQLLRTLCWNTDWNYAVFWKLKHYARMVLTCEDAYYYNHFIHDPLESKSFSDALETWHDDHFAHDSLGLAVAKMSYHVYFHGEGIVGQVAATGKHRWIFAGDHPMNSCPSPELYDGWQAQFSAGIKTIVVAAVVPHGVLQLGSLNKVNEDLKLLTHIRDLFSSLQDSSACHVQNPIHCSMQSAFDNEGDPSEHKLSKLMTSDPLAKKEVGNNADKLKSPTLFSMGSELHEALGPVFLRRCYPWSCEVERTEDKSTSNIPEITESSILTSDLGSDHLLEAVVANFYHQDATIKRTVSFSTSESMLTTEKMPSFIEERTQNCLNFSDSCSIRSSTTACREPVELVKPNKKRARPGENSRHRPRDRQLILDCIKELREFVPNGSKCNIDSLLERTIKNMVFLQSVIKHADKLSNCAESRGCNNETGVLGSGYEQGSSWAVEMGDHMKICPILVENLNMNGQMLIKMICKDSDHFLEIVEVIRSLGLSILKGVTGNHGDKTWMRFVVEGQSNRTLHRMDVLWSLVQTLQSKTTV